MHGFDNITWYQYEISDRDNCIMTRKTRYICLVNRSDIALIKGSLVWSNYSNKVILVRIRGSRVK